MSNRDYADLQELAIDYRRLAEETEMRAARLADALDALGEYIVMCSLHGVVPSITESSRLKTEALEGHNASK